MGAVIALALAPALTYALGSLAWTQVQVVMNDPHFTTGTSLNTLALGQVVSPLAAAIGALVGAHLTWTTLVLVASPRQSRLRAWVASLTPTAWRRLVTVATASTLSIAFTVPATATTDASTLDTTDAGWVTAPIAATSEAAPPSTSPTEEATMPPEVARASDLVQEQPDGTADDSTHVVVTPGDTLWDITATQLDIPAGDHAQIAAAWPALYDENRDVIGADPGLIEPNQRLTLPAEWTA